MIELSKLLEVKTNGEIQFLLFPASKRKMISIKY